MSAKGKKKSGFDAVKRAMISGPLMAGSAAAGALGLMAINAGPIPMAVSVILGAIGGGSIYWVSKGEPKQEDQKAVSNLEPISLALEISPAAQSRVEELHGLAALYERRNSPLFPTIKGVLTNAQELFSRMERKLDDQEARLMASRYAATLEKLNRALGKDYYLDIEAHPQLWSNPEERMEAVEKALNATGDQLIRNIRQLNASRDLIYQLSLDSLMASEEESTLVGEVELR